MTLTCVLDSSIRGIFHCFKQTIVFWIKAYSKGRVDYSTYKLLRINDKSNCFGLGNKALALTVNMRSEIDLTHVIVSKNSFVPRIWSVVRRTMVQRTTFNRNVSNLATSYIDITKISSKTHIHINIGRE